MSEIVEGKPALSPGVCFICELSNDVRYIDTFRDFTGVVRESLDGRKYLCEECVEDAAKQLGFITPKERDEWKDYTVRLEAEVHNLKAELANYKDLKKVVEFFGTENTVVAVKPKAPAKKPAAKA